MSALVKGPARSYSPHTAPSGISNKRVPPPKLLPLSLFPATPHVELLGIGAGRRALAVGLAVLITVLLLLLLIGFGPERPPQFKDERVSVISIDAPKPADEPAEPKRAESKRAETKPLPPPPAPDQSALPKATQPVIMPAPPAPPQPPATVPRIGIRPPGGQVYGPPNTGGSSSAYGDTERVGTAPNGEPLYKAAWYREPSNDELRGFLSTADGPGWGLIACRTVADFRVEDCVGLDEYPNGSRITAAVLAAAWQFRVRPPRLGGKPLVGAWVRIRIDYEIGRR